MECSTRIKRRSRQAERGKIMEIDANEVIGQLRQEVSDLHYENIILKIQIRNLNEQTKEEKDGKEGD